MTSNEQWIRHWFAILEAEYAGLLARDALSVAELGHLVLRLDPKCSGEFRGLPEDLDARRELLLMDAAKATARRCGVDSLWPDVEQPAGPVPDSPAELTG